jgi:hypothetical protein
MACREQIEALIRWQHEFTLGGRMNTANLELEGLYVAIAAVHHLLVQKGVITLAELQDALDEAHTVARGAVKERGLSGSNKEAICFPVRFLRLASDKADRGEAVDFHSVTREIGRHF